MLSKIDRVHRRFMINTCAKFDEGAYFGQVSIVLTIGKKNAHRLTEPKMRCFVLQRDNKAGLLI